MAFWNKKEKGDMAKKKTVEPIDETVAATIVEAEKEAPVAEPVAEPVAAPVVHTPRAKKNVLDELVAELSALAESSRQSAITHSHGAGGFAMNAQADAYEAAVELVKAKM